MMILQSAWRVYRLHQYRAMPPMLSRPKHDVHDCSPPEGVFSTFYIDCRCDALASARILHNIVVHVMSHCIPSCTSRPLRTDKKAERLAHLSLQKPSDQPSGGVRLLDELRLGLRGADLHDLRIIVAFAKQGPLLRLTDDIDGWRASGKTIRAIIGIDEQVTSYQALDFALNHFSDTTVVSLTASPFSPLFHPKVYVFQGARRCIAYLGSNNLTVGGTEINAETYIKVEAQPATDPDFLRDIDDLWGDAKALGAQLDRRGLDDLRARGMLADELQHAARMPTLPTPFPPGPPPVITFPAAQIVPPSAIPRSVAVRRAPPGPVTPALAASILVIQVNPHPNGEIFLSKLAVNQDPVFFDFPFSGQTTPRRAAPYPQRIPDPVVDLRVYDATGNLAIRHSPFNLNTVYYSRNAEIRITVPPNVVHTVPYGSLMVMEKLAGSTFDYNLSIYVPGSPTYTQYLAACNQTMPSGGAPTPRRFGWL